MPVGHARAGGTAGSLVVVVDAEAGLHHHVAVVVSVLAAFICSRREKNALSTRGSRTTGERKRGEGPPSWSCCLC